MKTDIRKAPAGDKPQKNTKPKGLKIDTKYLTIALILVVGLFFFGAYYSFQFLTLSKQPTTVITPTQQPVIEPEEIPSEQSKISDIIEETVTQPESPILEEQKPSTEQVSEPSQSEFIIEISKGKFYPKEVTVKVGTTVTWANNDDRPHKVAAKNRYFYGEKISSGEKYSFTFNDPGEYDYFDVIFYRTMKGKITVEEQK